MQENNTSQARKNLIGIFTITLSIGVLLFLLLSENGIRNLRRVLFHLKPVWLLWIGVGVLAGWLLESYVIHLFCKHLDKKWTFGQSFYVGMLGLFYSALTPFCMGEPMEVYNMTKMGMDTGTATSIIAVKSLVHHAVTFVYAFLLVSFELSYFQANVSNFAFLTIFGLITNSIFIFMVVLFMINEKLTNGILLAVVRLLIKLRLQKLADRFYASVHSQLENFHESSKIIGKSYKLYISAVFLTLIQITFASLISYFVYRSFNLHGESVFTMVAADTFVVMVASFIPLPGSSGGAEGAFYLFFHDFFGASIIPAITLWRIATCYINLLFGFLVTIIGRRKYRANKRELTGANR